ncbi:MAG: hypothetical protein GYA24_04540 [Candidatus Lokiarchaeota archaeon]|nr:hypothetical protein [Candidatus Lokiarchaeota archaeon]
MYNDGKSEPGFDFIIVAFSCLVMMAMAFKRLSRFLDSKASGLNGKHGFKKIFKSMKDVLKRRPLTDHDNNECMERMNGKMAGEALHGARRLIQGCCRRKLALDTRRVIVSSRRGSLWWRGCRRLT